MHYNNLSRIFLMCHMHSDNGGMSLKSSRIFLMCHMHSDNGGMSLKSTNNFNNALYIF
jgi:hypothetical protein